jgi:hypothetical protein
MQPAYPPYAQYQPPVAYGAPSQGIYDRVRDAAGPAVVLMAICAGWPVLSYVFSLATSSLFSFEMLTMVYQILFGLQQLLQLVAVILFFVWLHRVHVAVRQEQGSTQYTPGMAVGGWFIPFANFVLPFLSMRDVWQRKMGSDRSFIVPVWWVTYLLTMLHTVGLQVMIQTQNLEGAALLSGFFPLPLLVKICAFASWLLMIRWLTDRAVQQPAQPGYPQQPYPQQPYPQQPYPQQQQRPYGY